ncbi:MAG: type 2 isopentenyl-diphosphate Delta-isomerase [Candidatus Helarchaeota archaeon]
MEHIKICLANDVEFKDKNTGFEDIELVHHALPELNYHTINLKTPFFGRTFDYPILIESLTGGHRESIKVNQTLSLLAAEYNIPMEVGSQRAAVENANLIATYRIARDISKDIFLIGNIGAAQLVTAYGIREIETCIEMIEANALAIHLNPLQEMLQKEGDLSYQNLLTKIQEIKDQVKIPIIIKETGNGLGFQDLKALKKVGIEYVDVGGAGGTSWAAVESFRYAKESPQVRVANTFRDWGIPTAVSTILASKIGFHVISSGGIRTGLDIAKAVACGAGLVGLARPFLKAAYNEDLNGLKSQMNVMIKETKMSMVLTQSATLTQLKSAEKIIFGKLKQWLSHYD